MGSSNSAGAAIYPTRHPVMAMLFERPLRSRVRSFIPGNEAMLIWGLLFVYLVAEYQKIVLGSQPGHFLKVVPGQDSACRIAGRYDHHHLCPVGYEAFHLFNIYLIIVFFQKLISFDLCLGDLWNIRI